MLINYLKITLRFLWKNKTYSLINILGLAIGIAACAIVLLFVTHEYSYDKFHQNADRIYQVVAKVKWGEQDINISALSSQFGPATKEASADVINYTRTRVTSGSKVVIQSDADHRFFEEGFIFADSSFFGMFSFNLLRGDRGSLGRPNTVILTETTAKKYFGDTDPMGKIITYDKKYLFEVVGVAKNAPSNSTLQFDFIGSFSSLGNIDSEKSQYNNPNVALGAYYTYLLLPSEKSIVNVEKSIAGLTRKSVDEKYTLIPITESHQSKNATIFISVAVVILLLALINYVNLTTARATVRGKEVGIRKTIGARQMSLTAQFYLESALITLTAFGIAITLIEIIVPVLPTLLQQDIDRTFLKSKLFIGTFVSLLITCILLAGSYPAFVLSRFKPVDVLKGKLSSGTQGAWLRKGFTVFQFSASIALIICSLVVGRQLSFMRNKNIGLNKEQVMVIPFDGNMAHNYVPLKNELRNQSNVMSVAGATLPLYTRGTGAYFTQTPKTRKDVLVPIISADKNFFSTLGIEWISKAKDSIAAGDYIINEAGLEMLQITKEDLGTVRLKFGGDSSAVEGMVKDFNFATLEQKISGLVISVEHDTATFRSGALYVRLNTQAAIAENVDAIKSICTKYQPETPFYYYFLDDAFDKLYKSEDRLLNIFTAFTGIAVFIACLGLFGLITFTTERRKKEIGIRKILGASIRSILALLSGEFVVILIISMVIAAPVAWWAMQDWLAKFAYHTTIPLIFILMAGTAALVLALGTISIQAAKAAISNPVDSLKNE